MNYLKLILVSMVLVSCGYPKPMQVNGANEYKLAYCERELDCFEAAEKICPNGYTITEYGSIRPEKFKCKSE